MPLKTVPVTRLGNQIILSGTPTHVTTAGAGTYTAAQLLTGHISRDCAGASRTDDLPTAANILAALNEPKIGDGFDVTISNTSDGAETITVRKNGGNDANMTTTGTSFVIAQNASKTFRFVIGGTGKIPSTITMYG